MAASSLLDLVSSSLSAFREAFISRNPYGGSQITASNGCPPFAATALAATWRLPMSPVTSPVKAAARPCCEKFSLIASSFTVGSMSTPTMDPAPCTACNVRHDEGGLVVHGAGGEIAPLAEPVWVDVEAWGELEGHHHFTTAIPCVSIW
eukprot:CAMPEP_0117692044 /NCGR_PEP_ID=MMETSP0804-20121206/26092_1 /TAXON_ID=1074897 /ORGANISM="Tetraselmis astigmatica, Strain CCMP880" /LENGTH=148 /DNA_ID=CAMNT_0005505415 /DNA_START=256 /DNA_END=699 /DNA_ORIENTATION=-